MWYKGDQPIKPSKYFRMNAEGENFSLTISEAFSEDEGIYKCIASTSAATIISEANLEILMSDEMSVLSSLNDVNVCEGQTAKFTTSIIRDKVSDLKWFKYDIQIESSNNYQVNV